MVISYGFQPRSGGKTPQGITMRQFPGGAHCKVNNYRGNPNTSHDEPTSQIP